jgi:tRNA U34 5-methylaminomethyl-2-thiouridine-forming methyltransferase MnmC
MNSTSSFTPQPTADGSYTFFSEEFGELFHSHGGAQQEAECKFVEPTRLTQLAATSSVVSLLDICYGLGYNTAAALTAIWQVNPNCRVEWVGLESNLDVPQAAIAHHCLQGWECSIQAILSQLATTQSVRTPLLDAQLILGDARQTIQPLRLLGFKADAIFLDPFSPPTCPQLWTVEFLSQVSQCLRSTGYLATYSCSASVRAALLESGLHIGSTTPVGRRSPGTAASFHADYFLPLSQKEQEHLQTRAAIPYRDPSLSDCASVILQRRQHEQQMSQLESSSTWKKRWLC